MKRFDRMFAAVCVLIAVIFAAVNLILSAGGERLEGRQYRVDAARIAAELEQNGGGEIDLSAYPTVKAVVPVESEDDLLGGSEDYLIKQVGDSLYRIDYVPGGVSRADLPAVNIALGVMACVLLAALLAVRSMVLKPFVRMRELPYELSKGNLTAPLEENRHKLFGRFTWGMNMLRENLEQQKRREMGLQAEKKKLIISLSHDIKLPLSAIKLYAKALEKGMYDGEQSADAAARINARADEIEDYVSQIVRASNEDFLALTVENGEFYMNGLIGRIEEYYTDKLALLGTEFTVEKHGDCLLRGDPDRSVEVLQNIIENAVKYGDGRRISLSFSDEEDCRLITVRNSGCTLSPDELPHIFDSFYRGTNVADKAGSGLGLYICRTLMQRMGGEVFASCGDGEMSVTAVFTRA